MNIRFIKKGYMIIKGKHKPGDKIKDGYYDEDKDKYIDTSFKYNIKYINEYNKWIIEQKTIIEDERKGKIVENKYTVGSNTVKEIIGGVCFCCDDLLYTGGCEGGYGIRVSGNGEDDRCSIMCDKYVANNNPCLYTLGPLNILFDKKIIGIFDIEDYMLEHNLI